MGILARREFVGQECPTYVKKTTTRFGASRRFDFDPSVRRATQSTRLGGGENRRTELQTDLT